MDGPERQECDDSGILQLGSSAAFSDELRRSAVSETEEISRASAQISNGIILEEKLHNQAEKDRSHATKEMNSHLCSEKEAIERLTMDDGVMRGLINTLNTELLPHTTDVEDVAENRLFPTMKGFGETTRKRVSDLRAQIEEIQESLLCQVEEVSSLEAKAEKVETETAMEGLEDSLEKSIAATLSKLEILEEIKKRQETLRSSSVAAEKRLEEVEKDVLTSRLQLSSKRKELETQLNAATKRRDQEVEEHAMLEKVLRELTKREKAASNGLEAIKTKDANLMSFIKSKAERAKHRETVRAQRNELYSAKKSLEHQIVAVKEIIVQAQRSNAEIERSMEELQQKKDANDKREAEVILPARTESADILVEKEAARAILAKTNTPVQNRSSFENEKAKLSRLKSKRESIRKDFEAKTALAEARKLDAEEEAKETHQKMESLEKIAHKTARILEEQEKRLEQMKARQAKRNEAMRKLGVLQFGSAVIQESKRVERNFTVQAQP
ncbi:hypothetical protein ACA910_005121 [Epithemia clementina (nom. ined.)]